MLPKLAWTVVWAALVFVLSHVPGSHMARVNGSIMQNHSVKKWEVIIAVCIQKLQAKGKKVTFFS
jgi:hypothetical protein